MASQNTINQRVSHRGFVTKLINSVSGLLEEGKFQRLESVKRTIEEKMSFLQRLDGEILGFLKEEQEICNEIERSSDIRLNIQETIFQIDSKLKEISISENVLVVIQQILMVFWRILLKAEIIQTVNSQILA